MGTPHKGLKLLSNVLPLFLCLPSLSSAAPIQDPSTPSNWSACLMALLIFSAICLSAFKLRFVRYRRTSDLKGPAPVFAKGKYVHQRFKVPGFPAHMTCKDNGNCKMGFLIGLLGSPSFEIRSKPSDITLAYPGTKVAKASDKQDSSGDTFATYKANKFLSHGEQPETQCDLSASLTRNVRSRFPLPTQCAPDLRKVLLKKHCPQIIASQENLPWPHDHLELATLRLVKLYTQSQVPHPLCNDADAAFRHTLPAASPHVRAIAYLNRAQPTPASPLPSLVNAQGQKQGSDISPDMKFDLYNNPLPALVELDRQVVRTASSLKLSAINETCQTALPGLSATANPVLQLKSPVLGELAKPPSAPEAIKTPPVAYNVYDTLKRREKVRTSIRNRRSPPPGPSPLRTMVLPDIAEDDPAESKLVTVADTGDFLTSKTLSTQDQTSAKLSPTIPKERSQSPDPNINSPGSRESVLDFLSELAEEIKDWDESILLDEEFRNMIQRSQAIFSSAALGDVNVKCSTPKIPSPPARKNEAPPKFVSFWVEDSPGS